MKTSYQNVIIINTCNINIIIRHTFIKLQLKFLMFSWIYTFPVMIHIIDYTPITLIRNQQEWSRPSWEWRNFSKFCATFGREFQTLVHTRGGMSQNDVRMENSLYIPGYAIRRCFWITSGLIWGPIGAFPPAFERIQAAIKRFRRHSNCIPAEFF